MTILTRPQISHADARHLDALMAVMTGSFDPLYGEAWTASQVAGSLLLTGSFARHATDASGRTIGFTLARAASAEVELLLIAVEPQLRGGGMGRQLVEQVVVDARARGASEVFLEVRENNVAARHLYRSAGFVDVGRRPDYYAGSSGERYSAITMRRSISD
jgi:[ribosomal protein S18]-alanine N-acetyltransferase